MKTAFSTLGCPDFSWSDIYTMAKDMGFNGIELRGLGDDIFTVRSKPFIPTEIDNTVKKLKSLGLEVPCISSGCCLKDRKKETDNINEIVQYLTLASSLESKYIRILGDKDPAPGGEDPDDEYIVSVLKKLSPLAKEAKVTLLVETNGAYADTKRLKKLIDAVDSPYVAVLWDLQHPYRFFNESPEETYENIGEYVKYVHVKDSRVIEGKIMYFMMGDGDMPLREMLDMLKTKGYEGYVSLEWVKRWARDLAEAGIVFPQFAYYMRPYVKKHKHPLQTSQRGDGKYIWPKDKLIDYTFSEVLDRVCEEFPSQYAFRFTEMDYTRTYPEFRSDVDAFAQALIALGVKKGDHVAIWATNVPEWYITFWATVKIGAVLVTVNTGYKIYETEYLLRQSDTHTLVMIEGCKDSNYVEIMQTLCPELMTKGDGPLNSERLPRLKNVVTVGCKAPGCYTFEEAIEKGKDVDRGTVLEMARMTKCTDVCNMQYTSGTTGFPKGVMLTHYNVVNNGKNIGDCMDLSTADEMMIQVPMFHCFGMVLAMTACVTHGSAMSPITAFSPRKSLHCIYTEKITAFHGVPTMFIALLEHPDFDADKFKNMRTGIMAGSPCPIKVMEDVINKMHMSEICITYGQTEASPGCTMSKTTDSVEKRVNTVGQAMYGIECKIVDPETGEELPDNTDGEFVARGYNIMKGYYNMPEATAAAIDEDGWLHTGDLARRTPDGYFKITGRIKDMIIRGGENIYPKEIEDFIYTYDKVKDVQVIGVPDEQYGEEIAAYVIAKEGETVTEDEIKDYVRANMAKHKVPRYVIMTDAFPMNAAGKILKYKMREDAIDKLNLKSASKIETA